ncbi:MAG: hypothetical protein ACD_36C00161G0002 [uncultured bacterium]|nr:MAG: hypothetical protein ACD_36C00161G0002 [uncultured bacterium]
MFCDVGQGDGAYIRFPDGRDMVVDGGPNDKILGCLGRYMPFWDRHIDIVVMTHPQKDHMQGLISVFERYDVDYFVRSNVENTTEGYKELQNVVQSKNIPQKFVTTGELIDIDQTKLSVAWPSPDVLGATTDINDASVVFFLRYGSFDALFTGDATLRQGFEWQAGDAIEVLKVPHHGSKTGMNEAFVDSVRPSLAVISVGKNNTYGHPTQEILEMLEARAIRVMRTDQEGDIEVVSDGKNFEVN